MDFKEYCCICVEIRPQLENINEPDQNNITYHDKLQKFVPDQNWLQEFNLCKSCIIKLDEAYNFISTCENSEQLRKQKIVEIEVIKKERQTNQELFQCDLCKKTFKLKRFLKLHVTRIHNNVKKKVKKEEKDIKNEENVVKNDQENLKDAIVIEGDIKSDSKRDLKEVNYKESDDYDCDFFQDYDVASNYSSDEDHKKISLEIEPAKKKWPKRKDPLNCEYCGKLFNRKQHWSAHIRANHTFEKPYECHLCDAKFVNSHSLLIHKRKHNNEKPYICSACGKSFVCSGDLYHHSKIHLNKREYQCNICEKRFNTTSILRTHKIVKHTEPKEWKYSCALCNRRFPINSSLVVHMKRHAGVKDFSCHICEKKFFNKSELTKHVTSHSNARLHKCNVCLGKEYKNREGLRKHLKVAHNIGNWKAPKPVKKFACPMCPKIFAFNNKLQRHIFTHTGEKPFKCDYCEKKFVDNYYRRVHLKKEHNIEFINNS